MAYTTFDFSITDQVAHIRFNRPDKRNAMNRAFWEEIRQVFAVEIGQRRADVRVAVISSTGPHFTAGMDLSVFTDIVADKGDPARRRESFRRGLLGYQESFNVIEACRVPVLAAIQGGCIGGGVDMVSACDMRYCTADAFFVIKEIDLGMVADVGTLQRLPHLIPQGLVRELAYTGRSLPAAEALRCGLVNRVHETQAAMLDDVLGIARDIAAKSPLAIYGSKEMINYARDHTVDEALSYMSVWNAAFIHGDDMPEAMRATQEKRRPAFKDLVLDSKS
ncbi:MAG TPA: crotonase/enoyl-CoA hydratase family protein [Vineibacter sp.]|nr:crotonase/enoyl-CoA hydratase family protein [Vineibacter sp.]